ncbi:MAG: hypothetical protein AAFQ84_12175 [Pseudomonadota bacterium]
MPAGLILWSAAVFNMGVALAFVVVPDAVMAAMTGEVGSPAIGVMYPFAAAVFAFGLGYAWAAMDLERNRAIIRLAVIGKAIAFLMVLVGVVRGVLLPAAVIGGAFDGLYAGLFVWVLRQSAVSR